VQAAFPGYYRPTEEQFQKLWHEGTIALDANVLLNLYRYPAPAREDLISALKAVSTRLFVPHQAALEFQRNRLSVIASQLGRFDEVREVLKKAQDKLNADLGDLQLKKRHSSIDPEAFQRKVGQLFDSFRSELSDLEKKEKKVDAAADSDPIRDTLGEIVSGRIGPAPAQSDLDRLYAEGEKRYKDRRPPGYLDSDKARGEDSIYFSGELRLERQYGDLIMWDQILKAAAERKSAQLILVTDDDKADWWSILDVKGKKIIGPRPELVEEARSKASVGVFYMYSSERFLKYAREYLGVSLKQESIAQIRAVRLDTGIGRSEWRVTFAERAVFEWLTRIHQGRQILVHPTPLDFIVDLDCGTQLGYEVKALSDSSGGYEVYSLVRKMPLAVPGMKRLYLILVGSGSIDQRRFDELLDGVPLPPWLSVVFGHLESTEVEPVFVADFEKPWPPVPSQ